MLGSVRLGPYEDELMSGSLTIMSSSRIGDQVMAHNSRNLSLCIRDP